MPTAPLAGIAFAVGATFLLGMLIGVVLMTLSLIVRRQGSALAARLLLSGPAGCLLAAGVYLLSLDFLPILFKLLLIAVYLATAVPVLVWSVRAKIRFSPIGRART